MVLLHVRETSYDDPIQSLPSVSNIQLLYVVCIGIICQGTVFIFREMNRSNWAVAPRKPARQFPLALEKRWPCSQPSREWQPFSMKSTHVLPLGHKQFSRCKRFPGQSSLTITLRVWLWAVSGTSQSVPSSSLLISAPCVYKPDPNLSPESTLSRCRKVQHCWISFTYFLFSFEFFIIVKHEWNLSQIVFFRIFMKNVSPLSSVLGQCHLPLPNECHFQLFAVSFGVSPFSDIAWFLIYFSVLGSFLIFYYGKLRLSSLSLPLFPLHTHTF